METCAQLDFGVSRGVVWGKGGVNLKTPLSSKNAQIKNLLITYCGNQFSSIRRGGEPLKLLSRFYLHRLTEQTVSLDKKPFA